jgi:hypothetical protein
MIKDETGMCYVSEPADISESYPRPQLVKASCNKNVIELGEKHADHKAVSPLGHDEDRDTKPKPLAKLKKASKPANKASIANPGHQLNTSSAPKPSDHDDGLDRSSELSEASPVHRRGHAQLLGHDIRDGKRSRPPVGTWSKALKRRPMKSGKRIPETTTPSNLAAGSLFGRKVDREDDVFGPTSPTSNPSTRSKDTRGSLQIEVMISLVASSAEGNSLIEFTDGFGARCYYRTTHINR